ncbi:MAG: AAA family ATPase, partial [Acidobacteria bacterium]|nr:AAA family ATPase [Acidobacteriota bacterium]
MPDHRELSADDAFRVCDPAQFDFETTANLPPPEGIIGQKRAVSAIHFGLSIEARGYNLYLAGESGTGRTSLIRSILARLAKQKPVPPDICLVNNFRAPDQPRVLYLQPGLSRQLKRDVENLVESLRREIPQTFEGKGYEAQQAEVLDQYQQKTAALFSMLQKQAGEEGIQFQITPAGVVTRVVKDGQPLSQEQYDRLPDEEKEEVRQRIEKFNQRVLEIMDQVRDAERETRDRVKELERQTALIIVQSLVGYLQRKYTEHSDIVEYLEQAQHYILENISDFRRKEEEQVQEPTAQAMRMVTQQSRFIEYQVNILVDNSIAEGAPVIIEPNPTYTNLFGAMEREVQFGALVTNFTMIKAGSLVRANGGYLIVEALDLFKYPFVWDTLKRTMEAGQVRIEDVAVQYGILSATGLRSEPINVKVKVILIGNPLLHYLLYAYDEDFQKLFKVKADFDSQMDRTSENVKQYAQFVTACCLRGNLKPFDRNGVAAVVEYGSRLAEDQTKLSTKFGEIADIMTEASYWASHNGNDLVRREDVERAVEEKIFRSNRIEERIQEMIARGFILVDTAGGVPGQVNGLSVITIGDYEFGKPVRITCETFAGKSGMTNVEQRAKLSGSIHNKAFLILTGYLGAKFGRDKPLLVTANMVFEQTYERIEGDSASIASVVALLSSLAGAPVKQNLAVTGSINQKGEVQPIGGVDQKIEGFFTVCKIRGLTGEHGVIIPHQNVANLMLNREVVEAIR